LSTLISARKAHLTFLNLAHRIVFKGIEEVQRQVTETGSRAASDDDLMRACQEGDVDAFEVLVSRYRRKLHVFITHIIGDEGLAEDFLQETFLRVYLEASDYLPMGRFRGWLYTIARNLSLNSLNYAARHRGLTPDAPMILWNWEAAADAPAENSWESKEELLREVAARAEGLSEKHRHVVLLRYFHGLSIAEIAEVEECPVGTVKSRLHHAIKELRYKIRRPVTDV